MQVLLQLCSKMQVLRRRQSGGLACKVPKSPGHTASFLFENCPNKKKQVPWGLDSKSENSEKTKHSSRNSACTGGVFLVF